MQYIQKGDVNYLVLNINNNARPEFTGYTMEFVHIMSKELKTYTISTLDPLQYSSNIRYCTLTLDLTQDDLNYLGQYQLKIYGDGTDLVYITMGVLQGQQENNPFTEYISPNEVNENYIYVQD